MTTPSASELKQHKRIYNEIFDVVHHNNTKDGPLYTN